MYDILKKTSQRETSYMRIPKECDTFHPALHCAIGHHREILQPERIPSSPLNASKIPIALELYQESLQELQLLEGFLLRQKDPKGFRETSWLQKSSRLIQTVLGLLVPPRVGCTFSELGTTVLSFLSQEDTVQPGSRWAGKYCKATM